METAIGLKYLQRLRGFGLARRKSTGMDCYLRDHHATHALGTQLAEDLPAGSILLLSGPLGAGKTALVQGIAAGLGIHEAVTSPTFALAQHYSLSGPNGDPSLIHLDLYRLENPDAADELFAQEEDLAIRCKALLAVEWPERLSQRPHAVWQLQLSYVGAGRQARLSPPDDC